MNIPSVIFDYNKTKQAEFEIFDLEELYERKFNHHSPDQCHKVKFFVLIYIMAGHGSHMIDFVEYPYLAGSVIFVQPEQVQAFDFSHRPKGKVLVLTQGFLDQVHANMRLPNYTPLHLNSQYTPIVNLDTENHERCQKLVSELTVEVNHACSDPLIVMYLFSTLSLMLHRLRPELKMDTLSQSQSIKFARFIELLCTEYRQIKGANWYADQLNMTYKTLNHICKLATELTAKQLIDSHTILEIKRLLLVGNVTTQQLAFDHGFEDVSNFVKYFKKHTHITPSQFKKQYLSANLTGK
ncbi:AraC family transcriptional regulator [Marinomonas sp. C2222]|uniref:AraC family transcriptional regulator n=1 Tax=Marinomonas sargassi TaxID=2984494 RepID=A0ABT2YVZ4_9GAMM|nr:helix-turn-helix transcriptional regulator [Marinomonas sargassi]MCV2404056.1 AraC family transcriptional regulator [Marinomonas sargassi]